MDTIQKKILIIDDDEMILKSLVSLFEMENFVVYHAHDGEQGLKQAIDKKPDVVVTDIEMQNMSGINVLHEIRKQGDWGHSLPVVIFSNFDGDKETLDSIKSDKPSLFLKKSEVNAREILIKVKELFNEN
jgi:DNA-binding response OmpR family regulator